MISGTIKSIREEYTEETTLPHSRPKVGHTQYYSEWLEIKMMQMEQSVQILTEENKELKKDSDTLSFFKHWMVKKYRSLREFLEIGQDTIKRQKDVKEDNSLNILIIERRNELAKSYMEGIKGLFKFNGFNDLD